jgi:preprotein translocase subunit SecD
VRGQDLRRDHHPHRRQQPDPSLAGAQLAIVLDGKVLSAPVNDLPITAARPNQWQLRRPFTQVQAQSLANSLKYGSPALELLHRAGHDRGPQLASNQLNAGIVAGIVGLLLVVLYCLAYYRGLGWSSSRRC